MFIGYSLIVVEMKMIRFFLEKCIERSGKICMPYIQSQPEAGSPKLTDKFRSLKVTAVEGSEIFHNEPDGELLLKNAEVLY